jgi:hypothetical protein
MLNTCNWLLGRDDRLPRDDPKHRWAYPRVQLESPQALWHWGSQADPADEQERDRQRRVQQELWHWGTQVGLPALFLYLGLVVLLVRRMR